VRCRIGQKSCYYGATDGATEANFHQKKAYFTLMEISPYVVGDAFNASKEIFLTG
jgi:hypothetical protein